MKSKLLKFCSNLLYKLLSFSSQEKRFDRAVKISSSLAPIFRRLSILPAPSYCLDNYDEYFLSYVLNSLTYKKLEFNPRLRIIGADEIKKRNALMLTGHFYLNMVFSRWLYDNNYQQMCSMMKIGHNNWWITGTDVPFEIIYPDKKSLIRIKQRIEKKYFVVVPIDSDIGFEGWRKVDIPDRELFIAESVIKFAVRAGIPILFLKTRLSENKEIIVEIGKPSSDNCDLISQEFTKFITAHLVQ